MVVEDEGVQVNKTVVLIEIIQVVYMMGNVEQLQNKIQDLELVELQILVEVQTQCIHDEFVNLMIDMRL